MISIFHLKLNIIANVQEIPIRSSLNKHEFQVILDLKNSSKIAPFSNGLPTPKFKHRAKSVGEHNQLLSFFSKYSK